MPKCQACCHLALCAGREAKVISVRLTGRTDSNRSAKIPRIAVTPCRQCAIVGETQVFDECRRHVLNCLSHDESTLCAERLRRRQDTMIGIDDIRRLIFRLCLD